MKTIEIKLTKNEEEQLVKFEKFLRKERVLTKFKKNLRIKDDSFPITTLRELISGHSHLWLMSSGFDWGKSPEGEEFWCDLDDKYDLELDF